MSGTSRSDNLNTTQIAEAADEAVEQRCASSPDAAATPRLSLLRIAVVERQLVMQGLDITSLVRLASTCRQLRGEALRKEAGKFIPAPPPHSLLGSQCWVCGENPAHASPLFRMHLPVRLRFSSSGDPEALIAEASQFARITELSNVPCQLTEERMLQLLAQPWIQPVTHVDLHSAQWHSFPLQHALFTLPQLRSFHAEIGDCAFQESAMRLASKLTSANVILFPKQAHNVRATRTLPVLTDLTLISENTPADGHASAFAPLVWCLPPMLTSLTLSGFSLEPDSTPRSVLKAMFRRLPKLKSLHTECEMEFAPLLQGILDAGVKALPDLRRVESDNGVVNDLGHDLLRRFLHKFTAVTVRFCFARADEEGLMEHYRMAHAYGAWPRVEFEPGPTDGLPSPHPSDDEAESDVEAAEDPHDETNPQR